MRTSLFTILLLFATACFSQDKPQTQLYDKAVQWVDIRVPAFPPLARQARIQGTVAIEVRFKGCELDPASLHVVSGHPMLIEAALRGLKQSALRCGDFPDSTTTVYYEFGDYSRPGCDDWYPRVEVAGSRVRILATVPCWQP